MCKAQRIPAHELSLGQRIASFVEDINAAKNKILIVSGEANPAIYNNREILNALKLAKDKRHVSIDVQLSPVIATDEQGFNGIVELAEGGYVNLFRRECRVSSLRHYRIIDEKKLWAEDAHEPLAPVEERDVIISTEPADISDSTYNIQVYNEKSAQTQQKKISDVFLLIPAKKLIDFMSHLASIGKTYSSMTIDELRDCYRKYSFNSSCD